MQDYLWGPRNMWGPNDSFPLSPSMASCANTCIHTALTMHIHCTHQSPHYTHGLKNNLACPPLVSHRPYRTSISYMQAYIRLDWAVSIR